MYETAGEEKSAFWSSFASIPKDIAEGFPSLEKRLDAFFEDHFDGIIEEWNLVTEEDIRHLKTKLDYVCYQVDQLTAEKQSLDARIEVASQAIDELEKHI
jgi:hypothetical protein